MKKIIGITFAFAMILSAAFVSDSLSVSAQGKVVVRKSKNIASKAWNGTKSGGKYIYRKTAGGTRYVYRKTKSGTVYVGKQTYRGGKWTYSKGKGGTKTVIRKTKNAID
jgi:hypothetical protein